MFKKVNGACAIVFDEDKVFISFAVLKKANFTFLWEVETNIKHKDSDILIYLQENLETLDRKIREAEKKYLFRVEKVFLGLPWSFGNKKIFTEDISLKRRKRITPMDISFVRAYLEDKFLDWDDYCIHNIIINYKIEGVNYSSPPLGVPAKKIGLQSFLIWIKDKTYKETENIFGNLDRNFSGFIASQIGLFSAVFAPLSNRHLTMDECAGPSPYNNGCGHAAGGGGGGAKREKVQVAVSIDGGESRFTARDKNNFVFGEKFDFGLKKIIEELAKQFSLSFPLAEEVFYRYVSFKELPYFKEVTIKKKDGYIKLSTQTLNSFIKNYIKDKICYLLQQIKEKTGADDFIISFISRLNMKEGFYGFLKDCVPYSIKVPIEKSTVSFSSGCLRYGMFRFLERDYKIKKTFFQHILTIYKEYF